MTNPIKYILAIAFVISFSSCEKFLEVEPRASVSDEVTIYDKGSAESALHGVYNGLADAGYYGMSFQSIGYLNGDNIQWTGSQSQIQEFINHKVNPENATISTAWVAIYRTINRANNVIAKVPEVVDPLLTETAKKQILGEAYFVRALAYFDLARTWGGVPIVTKPTKTPADNIGITRSTIEQVYNQVLADLDQAETLLPLPGNIAVGGSDRYRANRKTAFALKARYYLYRNDWTKAEEYADKIVADNGNYRLLKPFNSFFANDARGTQESVFELFYNGTTEQNTHKNQWLPQNLGGTRQWAPNNAFVALVTDPVTSGGRSTLVAKDNQNRWYGTLYYRPTPSDPSYIIRTAELYLIRAEAKAQQFDANPAKLAEAIADLNAVRDRAGLAPTSAVTKEQVLSAIENERRLEFAYEPHRWFDLVRTGRAKQVLNITEDFRLVMPIPAEQLLADRALEQTLGYK
ncbi:RagB/SusD family nutrient uptake outer membrane protein [Pedobacter sp. SYSU D00535]|uniref:RagB/SusD family nutrient uptake outer membrane protein n=1 Tax=Pedobacter sp. SYSU D00535 TaxID=2810308 RepID=UPI001A96E83D|nr:RagB/SusD family nutrient uptake outer membrane protein [Pedobacter sp. SYSU D00535]